MEIMSEKSEEMCRLCMELGACLSMNEEYSRFPKPLPKMIDHCIGLSVLDDDVLPQHICDTCGRLLIIFYNYKNLCLQNDKKLKSLSSESDILKTEPDQNSTESLKSRNHSEICVKKEVESSDDEQYDMDLDDVSQPADDDWGLSVDDNGLDPEPTPSGKEDAETAARNLGQLVKPSLEEVQEMKGIGVHLCKTCNWQLDTWEAVVGHIDKNPNCDVRLKCKLCCHTFINMASLRTHIQGHKKQIYIIRKLNKNKDARSFSCNVCNEEYSERDELITHLSVHGINVKRCKLCNMCYNMIHRCMLKDYQCQKCPKKFAKLNSLKKHMLMHKPKDTK